MINSFILKVKYKLNTMSDSSDPLTLIILIIQLSLLSVS